MAIWRKNSAADSWSRVNSIWRKNSLSSDKEWSRVRGGWRRNSNGTWSRFLFNESDDFSIDPTFRSNASTIDSSFTNQDFISSSVITLTRGTVDPDEGSPTSYTMAIRKYRYPENLIDVIGPNTYDTSGSPTLTYTITAEDARYPSYTFRGTVFAESATEEFTVPSTNIMSFLYIPVDNVSVTNVTSSSATVNFRAFVRGDKNSTYPANTDYMKSIRLVVENGANPNTLYGQAFNGTLPSGYTPVNFIITNAQGQLDSSGAYFSVTIPTETTSEYIIISVDSYDTDQSIYSEIAYLPPRNTVLPSISPTSGTAGVTTFTCNPGTWVPNPTNYQYQWQATSNGQATPFQDVAGVTTQTWQPNISYAGEAIRCRVRASIDNGNTYSNFVISSNFAEVLGPARIPTFGPNTSVFGGFNGSVTNYTPEYNWDISTSAGSVSWGTINFATRTFSVTGLNPGQSATVTVTTSRAGYANGSASTTGSARSTYIVYWNAMGGTVSPTQSDVLIGSSVTAPTATRTGYTARNSAWWTDPLGGSIVVLFGGSYTPTSDINLYARWIFNPPTNLTVSNITSSSATVSWTANPVAQSYQMIVSNDTDGTFVFINNITATSRSLSLLSNKDYTVSVRAWSGSNNTGDVSEYVSISFSTPSSLVTVTWNANGGTVSPTSSTVTLGQSVIAPTPTRSGYTFNGWYSASSGGTFIVNAGGSYTPSSSITLYAQWTIVTQYTVTYNANGGTVSPTSTTVNAGQSVTLPLPIRTDYAFTGWFTTASSGGTRVGGAGDSYTPSSSITLYARWLFDPEGSPSPFFPPYFPFFPPYFPPFFPPFFPYFPSFKGFQFF